MGQRIYEVSDLPESGIAASAAFYTDHLEAVRALIGSGDSESLAVILPAAGPDHSDWRLALARALARAHAPARVNVIGGNSESEIAALLEFLAGAKGVTGHYLQTHE